MPVIVGIAERVKIITSNYTALITDDTIFANAASGAITITLPSAAGQKGKELTIIKQDATLNKVTVAGGVGSLYLINDNFKFISNGSSWYTAAYNLAPTTARYTQS